MCTEFRFCNVKRSLRRLIAKEQQHKHKLTDDNWHTFKHGVENVYNNWLILLNESTHKEEIELDRGLVLNLLDRNEKERGIWI